MYPGCRVASGCRVGPGGACARWVEGFEVTVFNLEVALDGDQRSEG